jgi:hypothetical protein
MSGCGARTAAGSLEAVFESSDVERFGLAEGGKVIVHQSGRASNLSPGAAAQVR